MFCSPFYSWQNRNLPVTLKRWQAGMRIGFQLLTNCSFQDCRMLTLFHIPQGWCWRIKATLTAVITGYTSLPTNYSAIFWLVCHCKQEQRRFSGSHNKRESLRVHTKITQRIINPSMRKKQSNGNNNTTITTANRNNNHNTLRKCMQ